MKEMNNYMITYDIKNTKDTKHYSRVKSELINVLNRFGRTIEYSTSTTLQIDCPNQLDKNILGKAIRLIEVQEGVKIEYNIK